MSNEEPEKKEISEVPDFADESFWRDFSRELHRMMTKAENSPPKLSAANQNAAADGEKAARRGAECLSFARSAEIGRDANVGTAPEKTHLENCRTCARRVAQYTAQPLPAPPSKSAVKIETPISPARTPPESLWARIFSPPSANRTRTRSALSFGLTGLAAILLGGLLFVALRTNSNQMETRVSESRNAAGETPTNAGDDFPANENLNEPLKDIARADPNANDTPPLPKNQKETPADENPPDKPIPDQPIPDQPALDLNALPVGERAAVREALSTGRIAPSADFARLRNVPLRRAGADRAAPLAPRNEATLAAAPAFRWRALENAEYQITVTDDGGREVAKSPVLAQNNWQIEKELPAGFYFWKVTARRRGETVFVGNSSPAMFKVLSVAEKNALETARRAVESNLASAILYARVGLLAEAERELNAELQKNPNSRTARKILAQVRGWRKN